MRKLTLIIGLLLCSSVMFAQKGKVMSATSFFTQGKLDKAKELIDEAINHEKCVNWGKAYLVRGQIYQAIYEQDSVLREKLNIGDALPLVWESYKKAMELDEKDKLSKDIKAQVANLVIDFTNEGVVSYNDKEYKKALDNFKIVLEINASPVGSQKIDTAIIFNAAVSAHNCNEYDQAAEFYKKAIELNYEAGRCYAMLANILLKERDAAYNAGDSVKGRSIQEEAVQYLLEGNKRFPEDEYMLIELINYYLMGDDPAKSEQYLDAAIKMKPDDANLYRAKGTLYEKLNQPEKAEEMYRKTLSLDPNDFVSQYNLGNIQLNKVIEAHKKVNEITDTEEYNAAFEDIMNQYESVVPYFERANELKPDDKNTLTTLKELYFRLRTKNADYQKKYDETMAKLNNL